MKLSKSILSIAAAVLLSSAAYAQEVGDSLIVYTGTGAPDELANEIVDDFVAYMEGKYGVTIDVQLVSGAAATSWVTFNTEWPNPPGDVYQFYTEHVREGAQNGWWLNLEEQFTPEEWALFDQDAIETMGVLGTAAPMELSASVLVVQGSLPADAVTSWDDLGKAEFERRTTFESALSVASGYNIIAAAALVVGSDWNTWFKDGTFNEEAARPAFEKVAEWARNALTLTQGSGTVRPLVGRGESLVSGWWWHSGIQEIDAGVPVRIVYPSEGVPAAVQAGPVVVRTAQNPVAAFEWVKYFQSAEVGKVADEIGYVSRIRLSSEGPDANWQDFMANANIVWVDQFRTLAQSPDYNQQVLDFYNRTVIQGQ